MIRHAPPRQDPQVTAPAPRKKGYRAEHDKPPAGLPEECAGNCGTSHRGLILDELRTEYGLSYEEIGAELGLKPTSVSAMLGKHRTGLLLDPPAHAPALADTPAEPSPPAPPPPRALTARQVNRIAGLWADGYEPSEISARLKVSTSAVTAALRENGLTP